MLTPAESCAAAIAYGQAKKKANALTALLCGGMPAALLAAWSASEPQRWLLGLLVGLLWANGFEYAYHRWFLHVSARELARRHLLHHASVGTPAEAEHVNLGSSPAWVALLFAVNGTPVVVTDLLLGLGVAPGILAAFTAYFLGVEEVHWRIHVGGWLPPLLRAARQHHLAHHARPEACFNVFLPLSDWLFGTARD